jgi:hypothetical protein
LPQQRKEFFCSQQCSERFWGLPSLLLNGIPYVFVVVVFVFVFVVVVVVVVVVVTSYYVKCVPSIET